MRHNVSMVSIAERLGISVSEVSRAFKVGYPMNPEKRELIKRTAKEMGYVRNEVASRLSMKPLTVCIIHDVTHPEFDDEIIHGFNDAERIYGAYKLICKYNPICLCNADDNVGKIRDIIEEAVNSGVDGIIISVLLDGIDEIVRQYSDKVKIALVNGDFPNSGRLFAAVNDTDAVARIAAQLIGERSKNGRCVVFTGEAHHWAHKNISMSFEAAAADEGFSVAGVYAVKDDDDMRTKLNVAFAQYPDITSLYATSAISIPICEYLHDKKLVGEVSVVTSDVYSRLKSYIKDGTVMATLYQNPSWQAYTALEAMYRFLAYGTVPPQQIVAKPEIVMRSNLHLYN